MNGKALMRETHIRCDLATQIDSRHKAGQSVADDDIGLARLHRASCPDCLFEQAMLDIIASDKTSGAWPELDDISERRLIDSVLAASSTSFGGDQPSVKMNASDHLRRIWVAAGVVAAMVALAAMWQFNTSFVSESSDEFWAESKVKMPEKIGKVIVLEGDVRLGSNTVPDGDAIIAGRTVETQNGRAVLSLPDGIALSLANDTKLAVSANGKKVSGVTLERGEILVSVEPGQHKSSPFKVVTSQGVIEVKGTIFSVIADGDSVVVQMHRGEVEISSSHDVPWHLTKGEAASLGDRNHSWTLSPLDTATALRQYDELDNLGLVDERFEQPESAPFVAAKENQNEHVTASTASLASRKSGNLRASIPRLSDIKGKAQSYQRIGDWSGAAHSWHQLILNYPGTPEAQTAMVSLGQLELEKLGHPARARRYFQRYLKQAANGPLAQEALFGKIRACQALHNYEQERETIKRFLKRFPDSIQAPRVSRRLEKIAD